MSGPMDALFGFFAEGIAGAAETSADYEAGAFNRRRLYDATKAQEGLAADALARGAQEAGRIRQRGSDIAAQQAVAFAASGIDSSTGTPAALGDASRIYAELDSSTAMNNARRVAMGHKEAGKEYQREAQRLGMEQGNRMRARETRTLLAWGKGVTSIASSGMNGGGM